MKSSNILKSLRAKRNINQEELADALNMSRQNYNIIENNLLKVELDMIFKIFTALNVNDSEIEEFFDALRQDYMSYNLT